MPGLSQVRSREELRELVEQTYSDAPVSKISNLVGQPWGGMCADERVRLGGPSVTALRTERMPSHDSAVNPHAVAVAQAIKDAKPKPDIGLALDTLGSLERLFSAANWVAPSGRPRSRYPQVLAAHMSRAYGLLAAIVIVCEKGFSSEAQLMLRALLELALSAAYLSEADHDARAWRFLEHEAVYKRKLADDMRHLERNSDPERAALLQARVAKFNRDIERFKRRYKTNSLQHWHGKDVRSLAAQLGDEWFEWYVLCYRPASWYAHPTVDSLSELLRHPSPLAIDQNSTLLYGPTAVRLGVVLRLAVLFTLKTAIRWAAASHIEPDAWQELRPLLERAQARFAEQAPSA
jgi:hypothetical protein